MTKLIPTRDRFPTHTLARTHTYSKINRQICSMRNDGAMGSCVYLQSNCNHNIFICRVWRTHHTHTRREHLSNNLVRFLCSNLIAHYNALTLIFIVILLYFGARHDEYMRKYCHCFHCILWTNYYNCSKDFSVTFFECESVFNFGYVCLFFIFRKC